jgi:hypothetical protein
MTFQTVGSRPCSLAGPEDTIGHFGACDSPLQEYALLPWDKRPPASVKYRSQQIWPVSELGQNRNLPRRNSNGRFASISGHAAASSRPRSGARCRRLGAPPGHARSPGAGSCASGPLTPRCSRSEQSDERIQQEGEDRASVGDSPLMYWCHAFRCPPSRAWFKPSASDV